MTTKTSTTTSVAADRGFTLIEVLVALAIVSAMTVMAARFFSTTARFGRVTEARMETRRGLRAALDAISRDLRNAGTCIGSLSASLALGGANLGNADQLRVRIGALDQNACVRTVLREVVAAASTDLEVESAEGFAPGDRAYVLHPDGSGEFFTISGVDEAGSILERGGAATRDYDAGSGIFALRERTYAIQPGTSFSTLTVATDGGPGQPVAVGIAALNVRYRLRRNCPACDVVDFPADAGEWALVNTVLVTVTATYPGARFPGEHVTITETIRTKPRNLLP